MCFSALTQVMFQNCHSNDQAGDGMVSHVKQSTPKAPRNRFVPIAFVHGVLLAALGVILCIGCSPSHPPNEDTYLIRVGDQVVTVLDFNRAFEIAQTAYPHNVMQNPADYRNAQIRLLNQMTEEMILLEKARELGIEVSEEEVETTISQIKADYPDDQFEQTLLEYAVSYEAWRKGIETRLLLEKLVEKELKDRVVITPDEIARYYKENYGGSQFPVQSGEAKVNKDLDEMIIEQLRREKKETVYRDWLDEIQKQYTIDINQEQWDKILTIAQRSTEEIPR
jgi:hypothetical protein